MFGSLRQSRYIWTETQHNWVDDKAMLTIKNLRIVMSLLTDRLNFEVNLWLSCTNKEVKKWHRYYIASNRGNNNISDLSKRHRQTTLTFAYCTNDNTNQTRGLYYQHDELT